MPIAKRIAAITVLAMALVFGTALTACSQQSSSAEDLIREDLVAQFEPIMELDSEVVDLIAAGSDLEEYGLTEEEFVTAILDGFDYSIDSITVEESSATAVVTVTCKSLNDLTDVVDDLSQEFVEEAGDSLYDMTEEDINLQIGQIMMQAMDQIDLQSTECQFTYTLVSDVWTIDESSEDQIYAAFF